MTTATQTVEQILRPLADRTIQCPECKGTGEVEVVGQGTGKNLCRHTTVLPCPPVIPDPRFEALRMLAFGGIDTSASAILRAIQACRVEISLSFIKASVGHPSVRETWLAVWPWQSDRSRHVYAETPEEALALALVKAGEFEADGRH